MIPWLSENAPFPPVAQALREPNGLLAAGGSLSADKLLNAYRQGIFPWFSPGDPVLWWSPDPRMVLMPDEFRLSDSLQKILRRGTFEVRLNTSFEQVMRACAAPRAGQADTWIDEQMIAAYCELNRLGHAISVETWLRGELVGGLYGVAIGGMFYGESMYSQVSNASKIALAHLCGQPFGMIDCQMHTHHLASLGAKQIPREQFIAKLEELIHCETVKNLSFATRYPLKSYEFN